LVNRHAIRHSAPQFPRRYERHRSHLAVRWLRCFRHHTACVAGSLLLPASDAYANTDGDANNADADANGNDTANANAYGYAETASNTAAASNAVSASLTPWSVKRS
jgi:hypothetical protein